MKSEQANLSSYCRIIQLKTPETVWHSAQFPKCSLAVAAICAHYYSEAVSSLKEPGWPTRTIINCLISRNLHLLLVAFRWPVNDLNRLSCVFGEVGWCWTGFRDLLDGGRGGLNWPLRSCDSLTRCGKHVRFARFTWTGDAAALMSRFCWKEEVSD